MSTRALAAGTVTRASSPTLLVALLAAAILLAYIDRGLLAVAGPLIKDELGLSATAFGLAVSAFFWVYAPAQLLCGWMVDRSSVYRLFAGGVGLWGVATALTGLAGGLVSLVLLRTLLGYGQSFAFPGSSKMIARHCDGQVRGSANGFVMAGMAGGQAAGAFVGGMIMAAFGWRVMCAIFGFITLLWLLPWKGIKVAEDRAGGDLAAPASVPLRTILGKRALWASCAAHFCNNYGFYFLITWLPLYLVSERGMSLELMATLTALAYATQAMAAVGGGWLSDHLVARGCHEGKVRKSILVLANLVKATAIAGIALAASQGMVVFWLVVAGITIGFTSAQNFAVPQIFAGPAAAGSWVGLQNFAANCSGILGPVITGILVDATDSYWSAFAVAGAFSLSAAGIWGAVVPRVEPVQWDRAE